MLRYIERLAHAIHRALAASWHQPDADVRALAAIHLCKGVPFYGYHERHHYYLKISYADPGLRTRLVSLLESGRVLGQRFQPHEAHVSYQLQWMLDYALCGCDVLECDTVYPRDADADDAARRPLTHCAVEADVLPPSIVNRRLARHAATQPDVVAVPSLRPLWAQDRARRAHLGLDPTPPMPSEAHRPPPSDAAWHATPMLAAQWDERVRADTSARPPTPPSEWAPYVMDAYDTVELFHPRTLDAWNATHDARSAKAFDLAYSQQHASFADDEPPCDAVPSTFPHESPAPLVSSQPSLPRPSQPERSPPRAIAPRADAPRAVASRTPAASLPREPHAWVWAPPPPSLADVHRSWSAYDEPEVLYPPCHYTRTRDVPPQPHTWAGRTTTLRSTALDGLRTFAPRREPSLARAAIRAAPPTTWQWAPLPPAPADVRAWLQARPARRDAPRSSTPAPPSAPDGDSAGAEKKNLAVLCLEVVTATREDAAPVPAHDAIQAVVYTWMQDADAAAQGTSLYQYESGVVYVSERPVRLGLDVRVTVVDSELELLNAVIDVVRLLDPEALAGYDMARSSWAYLAARAESEFQLDILHELGRLRVRRARPSMTEHIEVATTSFSVSGRHALNVWRLMRSEVALSQYTLEHVVQHVLHERLPSYSTATLSAWMQSRRAAAPARALRHMLRRVRCVARLLEKSEVLFRTAEFARMYGIDFFSVLSRGSQFRVESVLLRITKPRNFVLPSPNKTQVGQQNAVECIPLILEPKSGYYSSPVLVLDFQSLYPSVMMAYNLCYSTCLGRVAPFKHTYKLGFTEHAPEPGVLARLARDVYILPNGLAFVKPHVRESMLGRMLKEVLDARVMTKQSLKMMPHHRAFHRRQHAQQLALKLLANVTYGYCGASASGRMPCVEIADAVVQAGRETLEAAMAHIEATPAWGAEIVYGDTDSLFVHLPGKSQADAFRIGREIAEQVTARNPAPVRLNFEKVYLPCVLVAKKRYAGYKFESPAQARAVLDVKGLEIVRRDGHLALQRMQEACLRMLFETHDLSSIKQYCQRQWAKVYAGDVSPLHFVMAKEVRLGSYASLSAMPPGAAVATRRLATDPGAHAHRGERVPYLITHGAPGAKLNDLAVAPHALLHGDQPLHADYYVRRTIVPALARIFDLVGVDVRAWLDEMPRHQRTNTVSCRQCGGRTKEGT